MRDRMEREGGDAPIVVEGRAPGKMSMTARLQRRARDGNGVAAGAEDAIAALGGGGQPLPDAIRGTFERSLGAELGAVRIHTGDASAAAADAVGAHAFAAGNDIHFGAGTYQPGDPFGLHLLAHEVAHTQQHGSEPRCKLAVSEPGDAAELEADRAADAMVTGAPASVSGAAGVIHRDADLPAGGGGSLPPLAADMGAVGYPDQTKKDAADKETLGKLAKGAWKQIKKTAPGAALMKAIGDEMKRVKDGAISSPAAFVLSGGVVAGAVGAILIRIKQSLPEKELPADLKLVLNALDIDDLSAIGLPEFGFKLELEGPLRPQVVTETKDGQTVGRPTETKGTLTISYTPGANLPAKGPDAALELAKANARLAKSINAFLGDAATTADEVKAMSKLPSMSKYADDPLHPKPAAAAPPGDPTAALSAPFTFGSVTGFAEGSAAVTAGDAARLRTMAGEINALASADHSIVITVYGHLAAGEPAELAGKRAEAACAVLRGTVAPAIKIVANQTRSDGGRGADVVFLKLASAPQTTLALPARPPVE